MSLRQMGPISRNEFRGDSTETHLSMAEGRLVEEERRTKLGT